MYLEEIYLENTGPISKCHVKPPFDDNGNPLPVVIVGPNGSGKSIFLSYIVDALTEFAKKAFDDIVLGDDLGGSYFRNINQHAIRSGEDFSLSLLRFKATDGDPSYCEKVGVLDPAIYSLDFKSTFDSVWDCLQSGDDKTVSIEEDIAKAEMEENAHAFFPARRYEDPDWLNPRSLESGLNPSTFRFNRLLEKPLQVETCAAENISWVLDVFLDSSINPEQVQEFQRVLTGDVSFHESSSPKISELRDRYALGVARQNVESILQEILQDEKAELLLNFRDAVPSRLAVQMSNGQRTPNLQSLSEGQSQLFHLFATIIRYGERTNISISTRLSEITGLVIIDEIDTHLHTTLQHDVVPKLIELFPRVQFIVSSHSPLFLLGMENKFSSDGLAIFELPEGKRINSERFTEFGNAFEYYQDTERFEEEIKQRFADMTKPVLLTEGKTDAQYIQTALMLLEEEDILNSLEISPVGNDAGKEFLPGGSSGLDAFCKTYVTHPSYFHHPILLLYDCDVKEVPNPVEKLSVRSIPPNDKNTKVKGGIENLFPAVLFQDCFYDENVIEKNDGGETINRKLNKLEFCQWICEERRNPNDFEKFDKVVEILKEFVASHQYPSVQQPTSE